MKTTLKSAINLLGTRLKEHGIPCKLSHSMGGHSTFIVESVDRRESFVIAFWRHIPNDTLMISVDSWYEGELRASSTFALEKLSDVCLSWDNSSKRYVMSLFFDVPTTMTFSFSRDPQIELITPSMYPRY